MRKTSLKLILAILLAVFTTFGNVFAAPVSAYPASWANDDSPITRAEFLSMLVDGAKVAAPRKFSDVSPGDRFYDIVQAAVAKGLVSGFDDGSLRPNSPITREEAVTMASRKFGLGIGDLSELKRFGDGGSVSAWAAGYFSTNVAKRFIAFYPDLTLRPKGGMTRAEAVRYLGEIAKNPGGWIPRNAIDRLVSVSENGQLVVVTTDGYGVNKAKVETYEKGADGHWVQVMSVSGHIGRYGFSRDNKIEGYSLTPRGLFSFGTAFGRGKNPGAAMPYRQIQQDDVWVDDPLSPLYNTWQKRAENNGRWRSAENMSVAAYNYGIVINFNTEKPVPYAGSAIFLHVYETYTAGCVGLSETDAIAILKWLDPEKNPAIIMCPIGELETGF